MAVTDSSGAGATAPAAAPTPAAAPEPGSEPDAAAWRNTGIGIDYVLAWTAREGSRELAQNLLDATTLANGLIAGGGGGPTRDGLEITPTAEGCYTLVGANGTTLGTIKHDAARDGGTLTLQNLGAMVPKNLLLGGTSKDGAGADAGSSAMIGRFGEGLKLAVLAYLREDKSVTIYTGGSRWSFKLAPTLSSWTATARPPRASSSRSRRRRPSSARRSRPSSSAPPWVQQRRRRW
jgi:hypothetical protein